MDYNFLDTEQENLPDYISIFIPTLGERRAVKAGSIVEVCLQVLEITKRKGKITKNYRFWCIVKSNDGKKLKCIIDDTIKIDAHPELQHGSEVNFEKKNIVSIYRKERRKSK